MKKTIAFQRVRCGCATQRNLSVIIGARSGNSLEFVRTPWMDSKRFNLLRQTEETTTLGLIRDQIQSYFQSKQYEKGSPEIDLRNINTYQLPESVKKNWLKR